MSAYPELVTGRADDFVQGTWEIRRGSTARGGASCNLRERILEVPFGSDPASRVVRAHELMHVRVSPCGGAWTRAHRDVAPRALECSEELRVNTLLERLGFSVVALKDGSEKLGGTRVAQAGDWREALCFLLAVLGTGGERDYLAGIRAAQPTWMAGLRAVRKRVNTMLAGAMVEELASTVLDHDGVGAGYARFTVSIARLIDSAADAKPPDSPEELRQFRRSLEPGGRRAASGRFAELVLDTSLAMTRRPRSSGARRSQPCAVGTVLRYPGRLLTDDYQRAFATKRAGHGGVVVIDQSGSMNIAADDLARLLREAPDAIVVGYSHPPGDRGDTANGWILAERGGVATHCPNGNVGNGVDGPVLRWAIARAKGRVPVVWVTDGQVTDSNDHPSDELTSECAQLVRKNRIQMVATLAEAGAALRCHSPFVPSEFGRVGRKLQEVKAGSLR